MKDLKGKVALVTGAASGIGRACAIEMARQGMDLVMVDLNGERLAEAAREAERFGDRVLSITADLSKKSEVNRVARDAVMEMGQVDLLYNNAGVALAGRVQEMKLADWEWVTDINYWGPIRLTHALLPHMIERRTGHIVTTASVAGLLGWPGLTPYSATKFAMVGFSEALRGELDRYGIEVSVVCPGLIRTNIIEMAECRGLNKGRLYDSVKYKGLSAEKAARVIVDGIRKGQGYILVAPEAKPLWAIKRLSPALWAMFGRRIFSELERRGLTESMN